MACGVPQRCVRSDDLALALDLGNGIHHHLLTTTMRIAGVVREVTSMNGSRCDAGSGRASEAAPSSG